MKKHIIRIIIIIVIIVGLIFWYILNEKSESGKIIVKVGYNTESVNHAVSMIAIEKDLFAKHGLEVELIALGSGGEVRQGLATGHIDIGTSGASNFFTPIFKGAPVKIISPSTLAATYLFVRPDSGVKNFEDLVGKKIGVRPTGSCGYSISYALNKEGIDLKSIEFIDIKKAYQPIALMNKKIIEAAGVAEYGEVMYREIGAVVLEEWETKGYLEDKFPRTVVAVNTDFLAQNPEAVEKFIDAFIESQKFIKENPDEAAQLISEHINSGTGGAVQFSSEDIKKTWQTTEYLLWYDPNIIVGMSKIAKEFGAIDRELTLEEIFDLRFEKKLKAAQVEIYETEN